uniref:Nucleotidyltransferase domain-containing protein n=1 Tax=Ignisphaera aggregans TaxID=334771 RepID=A0A7J2U415_9CREN
MLKSLSRGFRCLSEVFEERFRYYRFSKNEKEVLLKKIKEFLSRYDIDLAIVFGSFVEGDVFRDIDIAIYSYAMDLDKFLKINSELELELGIPVDIVPLDQLNPIFRLKILRKGLVVVEKPGVFEYFFMLTCDELEVMRIALNESLPRCT